MPWGGSKAKDNPCARGHDFVEYGAYKKTWGKGWGQLRRCKRRDCGATEVREGPAPDRLGRWRPEWPTELFLNPGRNDEQIEDDKDDLEQTARFSVHLCLFLCYLLSARRSSLVRPDRNCYNSKTLQNIILLTYNAAVPV